jgi:glycosyltransferase involved in cell wall biosynthesis
MTEARSADVTVVVPAYNEASRIASTLDRLHEDAPKLGILEVIVVDDGSSDGTASLVEAETAKPASRIRLVQLPRNQGKGAAVRAGVGEAAGAYIIFLDADLSAPPDAIPRAVEAIEAGADIAIGSRVVPGGTDTRKTQPRRRQISGRVFALLQGLITGLPYADTQCPFKLFRRDAADQLFPLVETSGWAFDVELLARARGLGMTVTELSVDWHHVDGSHIQVGPMAALKVVGELISIRRRVGRSRT